MTSGYVTELTQLKNLEAMYSTSSTGSTELKRSLPAVLQVVLVGDGDQFRLVPDQSDLVANFRGDLRTR